MVLPIVGFLVNMAAGLIASKAAEGITATLEEAGVPFAGTIGDILGGKIGDVASSMIPK
jgi:hypothetical protein